MPPSRTDGPTGVIHDIGYRPYSGPRGGHAAIAWSLYATGLRNVFGLGRSGKSKILPFALLALNILPALIIVGVVTLTGLTELPLAYPEYAATTTILLGTFAAAQGPILFSRDLRHGTISLYLARPLSATAYALARWGALATGIFLFVMAPLLVMYVGALLASMDAGEQTGDFLTATVVTVLLAGMLASVAGLFSAIALRRGFAVVGTIGTILFGYGVIAAIQGISFDQDQHRVGEIAGLFHPMTLYAGDVAALTDSDSAITPPTGTGMELLYILVSVVLALGGLALLLLRYRRLATR
ncbi:ABC transporter permease [Nocardioides sp. LHG3406-4]|uniref:ABC transporter permease n=1 Tax=Nocardioides sp. LHG3406-4 TaxID=2804575 RepID=UPI003CF1658E